MNITIKADKRAVLRTVGIITSYAGGKREGDGNAYERISTTDADDEHLGMFWDECRADLVKELQGMIEREEDTESDYTIELRVSKLFDATQKIGIETNLFSYFVYGITGRWYVYVNKEESGAYIDKATSLLEDIYQKTLYKKFK